MGNEILPFSPAHRRLSNPPFPSPIKRSLSGPDAGWQSLVRRHKFLLYTLGVLTFLCTIYLYFAITLGTRDSCSGLGGTQRAICQLAAKAGSANAHKAHHRRLMFVEDSGKTLCHYLSAHLKSFVISHVVRLKKDSNWRCWFTIGGEVIVMSYW